MLLYFWSDNNLFSESEHYTIVSVISPAFHQSPKTEIINTEQAAESCCQSAMVKISKQLSKFGNAGHSCLIFILSGFFIQLPFGLILHYGFFKIYIRATTTTMMFYSITSYLGGIILYLFFSFLYFMVRLIMLWLKDTRDMDTIPTKVLLMLCDILSIFQFGHESKWIIKLKWKSEWYSSKILCIYYLDDVSLL